MYMFNETPDGLTEDEIGAYPVFRRCLAELDHHWRTSLSAMKRLVLRRDGILQCTAALRFMECFNLCNVLLRTKLRPPTKYTVAPMQRLYHKLQQMHAQSHMYSALCDWQALRLHSAVAKMQLGRHLVHNCYRSGENYLIFMSNLCTMYMASECYTGKLALDALIFQNVERRHRGRLPDYIKTMARILVFLGPSNTPPNLERGFFSVGEEA